MNKPTRIKADLARSMAIVRRIEPMFNSLLNDNTRKYKLIDIEGNEDELCQKLDLSCGIDYLLDMIGKNETRTFALGSRVQYIKTGLKPFNSFTIRKWRESGVKTEYDKLKEAVAHDSLRPNLTMHVYCDKTTDEILSIGIARTNDIVRYIEEGRAYEKETGDEQIGHSKFWVVDWDAFKKYTNTCYTYVRS